MPFYRPIGRHGRQGQDRINFTRPASSLCVPRHYQ